MGADRSLTGLDPGRLPGPQARVQEEGGRETAQGDAAAIRAPPASPWQALAGHERAVSFDSP